MKRLIAVLLLAALLCGCGSQTVTRTATFYYCRTEPEYTGTEGVIAPEEREISSDLLTSLQSYCAGPSEPSLNSPLPRGCTPLAARVENGVLYLHFDAKLARLDGIDLTLAASCLARTFLPMTRAGKLVLTAEGTRIYGQHAITLGLDELDLQDDSLDRLYETFTVYYADSDRRYLIAQEVSVNLATEEDVKLHLLQHLQRAPAGLHTPLPSGAEILGVTTENGLCTVALGPEFQRIRFTGYRAQLLTLMAMVNTLTSLPDVDRVEFTVGGDLLIRYGSIIIREPLQKDKRLQGPVRKGLGEADGTLYLPYGEEDLLMALPTRLRKSGTGTMAESVMTALLSDSGLNGMATGIPEDTGVLSIQTSAGTCTVDLSSHYLFAGERLQLCNRLIAASLMEVDGISKVKITVNGGIPQGYSEDFFEISTLDPEWFL